MEAGFSFVFWLIFLLKGLYFGTGQKTCEDALNKNVNTVFVIETNKDVKIFETQTSSTMNLEFNVKDLRTTPTINVSPDFKSDVESCFNETKNVTFYSVTLTKELDYEYFFAKWNATVNNVIIELECKENGTAYNKSTWIANHGWNEFPTTFVGVPIVLNISENTATYTSIFAIRDYLADKDIPADHTVKKMPYFIINQTQGDEKLPVSLFRKWEIESDIVFLIRPLNYTEMTKRTKPYFTLWVDVYDGMHEGASTEVTINILKVEDKETTHVTKQTNFCVVNGKCFKSQKRNEEPYQMTLYFNSDSGSTSIQKATCTCPIGVSGACGHITGLLYQLAKFKQLGLKALPEDLAKTSQPQTWHTPRGDKIKGKAVQELEVCSYKYAPDRETTPRIIKSTVYNPIRGDNVDWQSKYQQLSETSPDLLILPSLQNYDVPLVNTKFGMQRQGSVLSYQQPLETDCVMNLYDGVGFPDLPVENLMTNSYQRVLTNSQMVKLEGLTLSIQEIHRFEAQTRLQSLTPLWFKIRAHRITASKIGDIFKRRKDFEALSQRLKTRRNFTTAAMRRGLACEPIAAMAYANKLDNKVNLYPCGVLVSLHAPWIAASPDRKVYHPERDHPFGLLEIKCPDVSSVLEVSYLKKDETGNLKLKQNHSYYYQILTQLAVTGLRWCDLYVWCTNDDHMETIIMNEEKWQEVKDKIDEFFFSFYI